MTEPVYRENLPGHPSREIVLILASRFYFIHWTYRPVAMIDRDVAWWCGWLGRAGLSIDEGLVCMTKRWA